MTPPGDKKMVETTLWGSALYVESNILRGNGAVHCGTKTNGAVHCGTKTNVMILMCLGTYLYEAYCL